MQNFFDFNSKTIKIKNDNKNMKIKQFLIVLPRS